MKSDRAGEYILVAIFGVLIVVWLISSFELHRFAF
jgi:hypothetical protein